MMTTEERQMVVAEMQGGLDDLLLGRKFFDGDDLPVTAKVSIDEPNNVIVVDLDERLGPRAYTAESEDMNQLIFNSLINFVEKIDGLTGITYRYGGHEPEYWPANRLPVVSPQSVIRRKRAVSESPLVVVAAGHGVYFHGGYKDWRAQRDPSNGVLEDDLTPVLAEHLADALRRDGVSVDSLRPRSQPTTHEPSKEPWWRLAARYQLAQKYPELESVWQSEPHGAGPMQERDEDIRSRPLYANHVGADALLHIHTNADGKPATNGFRTYIVEGPESRSLATAILCSAKELVGTDDRFVAFSVAPAPHVNGKQGENRLARMPSVIVEVGFHTSPNDAVFLQDRYFRALAMRGVAKGYRLYRDKLPCGQFAVNPVEQVTARVGVDVRIPFSFKGNPVYPIRVWSKDEKCSGRSCHDKDKTLSGPPDLERFKVQFLCKREDVDRSPIELTVGARDFDKVLAKPATYKVICTR